MTAEGAAAADPPHVRLLDGFVARNDGVTDGLGSGEQHGATRHHADLEMIGQVGLIRPRARAYTFEWEHARPNEASGHVPAGLGRTRDVDFALPPTASVEGIRDELA